MERSCIGIKEWCYVRLIIVGRSPSPEGLGMDIDALGTLDYFVPMPWVIEVHANLS